MNTAARDACQEGQRARTAATFGWVFTALGAAATGAGVWLLATAPPNKTPSSANGLMKLEVIPEVDLREQSVVLRGWF